MNQKQKEYAIQRLENVANKYLYKKKEKFTTPAVILNPQQRLAAFKKGEYVVKKDKTYIDRYTDIMDLIIFKAEKPEAIDKAYDEYVDRVSLKLRKAKDQIMLGDSATALDVISKFEDEFRETK